jgi:hypothetical protein
MEATNLLDLRPVLGQLVLVRHGFYGAYNKSLQNNTVQN